MEHSCRRLSRALVVLCNPARSLWDAALRVCGGQVEVLACGVPAPPGASVIGTGIPVMEPALERRLADRAFSNLVFVHRMIPLQEKLRIEAAFAGLAPSRVHVLEGDAFCTCLSARAWRRRLTARDPELGHMKRWLQAEALAGFDPWSGEPIISGPNVLGSLYLDRGKGLRDALLHPAPWPVWREVASVAGRAAADRARVRAVRSPNARNDPLVSVRIATYNRAKILVERTLPSVFAQTYRNWEVVIATDRCTDDTIERVRALGDSRVRVAPLTHRGEYPGNPWCRWRVAGAPPMNHATRLARGEWIAPLDDDDTFEPDHIEKLLDGALQRGAEMIYGIVPSEEAPGRWVPIGAWPPEPGAVCHSGVLYRARLKFMEYDAGAWRRREPADWALWKRMYLAGVRMTFLESTVAKHYLARAEL